MKNMKKENSILSAKLIGMALTVALVGLLSCTTVLAEVWNAANDFSDTSNPNGVWTFGTGSNGQFGTVFDTHTDNWIPSDWISQPAWYISGGGDQHWNPGALCKSNGTCKAGTAPAGRLAGIGNYAAVWTAPRNTTVNMSGDVFNIRTGCAAMLVVKGSVLFAEAVSGRSFSNPYTFLEGVGGNTAALENISVNAGDTIMVIMGSGVPGNGWGDYAGLDFTISEGAIPGGSITGKITDGSTGAGIDGAAVTLDGTGATTTTADGGNYTFTGVSVGAHSVAATKSGYTSSSISALYVPSSTVVYGDLTLVAVAGFPHMWDAAADFSSTSNPSGAWSYGYWSEGFHPFDAHTSDWISSDWDHVAGWYKAGNQQWDPGGLCRSNGTFKANPSACPAGSMAKYGNAVVRWTAPRSCTVNVFGKAFNMRNGGSFMLFQNDENVLVSDTSVNPRPIASPFLFTWPDMDPTPLRNIAMNQGDTLSLWLTGDYVGFDFLIGDAGDAIVTGTVTDSSTGVGIANATVALEDTSFVATTASDGTYAITDVPSDNYTFTVSKGGYITKSLAYVVPAGNCVTDIALLPAASVSVASAKAKSTGWAGNVVGIVSAAYTDYDVFYLEDSNRTVGLKITPLPTEVPVVGTEVVVFATKQADGAFLQTSATPTGNTVNLAPLGSANKSLIPAAGLNNELLLVRCWGTVLDDPYTAADGTTTFHIGDGSSSSTAGSVFVPGGTSNAIFADNFDAATRDSAWVDAMGTATIEGGKLVTSDGTNEVVLGNLSIMEPIVDVDVDASAQAAILARFADTSSFILAFYSPAHNTVAFHEKVNGNWGGWLNPVWNGAFTKTGTVHLNLQVVGNQATLTVSDGVNQVVSTTPLTTLHSAGLVGLYHDTGTTPTQNFDNFSVTAPVNVHTVPADVIEVVIPPSVAGTATIAKDDYVAASGILTKLQAAAGKVRSIIIRDAADLTPNP